MLTHKQVWNAIDTIAERYGFSASGLAKKSGLDPTSFNPSKRNGPDGRPRWPTMESISRLLQASGASMEEFSELLIGRRGQPPKLRQIPLHEHAQEIEQRIDLRLRPVPVLGRERIDAEMPQPEIARRLHGEP